MKTERVTVLLVSELTGFPFRIHFSICCWKTVEMGEDTILLKGTKEQYLSNQSALFEAFSGPNAQFPPCLHEMELP